MNKIMLIGNIGHTPDITYRGETQITRFSLAVKRDFSKNNETDWFRCVSFGKTAENIAKYFGKGSKIAVVGRVQVSTYEGKDGAKKTLFDVIVESFDFCDGKGGGSNAATSEENPVPYREETVEDGEALPF